MARYPVLKPQKTAQERLLRLPEQRHVATTLAAAQRRQQPNHQHLNQIVARRVAPARVLNMLKKSAKTLPWRRSFHNREHRFVNRITPNSYPNLQKRIPCG
jgi:hypothetical protein